MNRTHESGRSNGNKLVSTLTVAGIGITALTSCAADQEPEAPIQTEVESTFVTEIPITPSPIETETPTPLPSLSAESDPTNINIPQPSTNEETIDTTDYYTTNAERFDISVEEYKALVESYRIKAPLDAEPKEVALAVVDVLQVYINNGLDTTNLNAHDNWSDPTGEVQSGKGSWLNTLHTEALREALAPNEESPTWLEDVKARKGITTGLYIVSTSNSDPGYNTFLQYNFTTWNPKSTDGAEGYGIVGTLTLTSNVNDNPSIQNHARLPEDNRTETFNITVSKPNDKYRLDSIES